MHRNDAGLGLAVSARGGLVCAAVAVLLGVAAPAQSREAHRLTIRHRHVPPPPIARPVDVALDGSGVFFHTPFVEVSEPFAPPAIVRLPHYRGPDGAYDDLGDLSASIQGYPCGQECTNRSLARWGYPPVY